MSTDNHHARDWSADDVADRPGYGTRRIAAYRHADCGAVVPQTFSRRHKVPPPMVSNTLCPKSFGGCGGWGPMALIETVRWDDG